MKSLLFVLGTVACALPTRAYAQRSTPNQDPIHDKQTSMKAVPQQAAPAVSVPTAGGSHTSFVAPNDNCASATVISGFGPFSYDNTGANTDGPATCGLFQSDVWYDWTAPSTNLFIVDLCAGAGTLSDSEVAVYDTGACVGTELACNDDYCNLVSHLTFNAVGGNVYKIRIGGYAGSQGTGAFTIAPPPPPPVNDDCSAAIAVSGSGPFAFDSSSATTSSQGQNESLCNFHGLLSLDNDIWFTWTATASGQASVSTCGQTSIDSKIAVYPGSGCPSSAAIGCSDDACGTVQSTACFPVTSGQTYTIQLGTFPGAAGGTGTFSISITTGVSACQYDDGSSENMLGWTAGGDMVWLQRFGSSGGGSTTVSNIQVAYGSAMFPGLSPGNFSPVRVAIWDDPNDDGDPTDAVLLQVVNTVVFHVDTDQLNTVAITPVTVNGVFFVGASEVHQGGANHQYVAVMDQSSCLTPGVAWFCGNDNATPADLTNLANNVHPPVTFDSVGLPCNLLLRAGCDISPVSAFCLPGQSGVHACPCSNPPAGAGLGCNNFGVGPADSGTLTGAGSATVASDTLVFTSSGENNTSFTIFAQGTTQLPAGVVFGAGVRCVAGTLKRLYVGNASSGTIARPGGGDPSVHARSAALGYTIVPPITLYYFAYYRDPSAAGPCGSATATFNSTQAGSVLWQ